MIPAAIDLLKSEQEVIIETAANFSVLITKDSTNLQEFTNNFITNGAIPAIIQLTHSTNLSVLKNAITLLSILTFKNSQACEIAIGSNAMPRVLDLLQTHSDEKTIRSRCLETIESFTLDEHTYQADIFAPVTQSIIDCFVDTTEAADRMTCCHILRDLYDKELMELDQLANA